MSNIVARESECKMLEEIYRVESAAFIAIYGRRRVGKTYLIKNYFKDKGLYFHLTGVNKASLIMQLNNFCEGIC